MRIAVLAGEEKWNELKNSQNEKNLKHFFNEEEWKEAKGVDAHLNLVDSAGENDYRNMSGMVMINSVLKPIGEMNANPDLLRMNGWNGFLSNPKWEIAGMISQEWTQFFSSLGKQYIHVADTAGLVSPRVIAMLINEAYFALEEKVSTEEEIDRAMKLGTNYPFGPFEWGKKIGIQNIHSLLKKISQTDNRYTPASSMEKELAK